MVNTRELRGSVRLASGSGLLLTGQLLVRGAVLLGLPLDGNTGHRLHLGSLGGPEPLLLGPIALLRLLFHVLNETSIDKREIESGIDQHLK